jgi:alkylated DNA nucleotide flippase Atl1
MPRSDEAQAFFHAVYSAVQEIPPGKVTSYGHIAKLVGTRKPAHSFPVLIHTTQITHTSSSDP